jgi:Asp-tRNA(Asn)/Glu-tRNA(Gln) amidotransferase A subunit family amidase
MRQERPQVVISGAIQTNIVAVWAKRLAGIPALSMPCGPGAKGRPVGLQLMANHFDEARLLGVAHRYQMATGWHQRIPAGY